MREKYLGDSYDLVKRFWADSLRPVAPLYAHPQFIPEEIRQSFSAVTSIPILDEQMLPANPFGILLDPDTGIPLHFESAGKASASHAPLLFITDLNKELKPTYMICFDQSHHRRHDVGKAEQLERKRAFLLSKGISSFYYRSHAPFLFMAENEEALSMVKNRLVRIGVPEMRFDLRAK